MAAVHASLLAKDINNNILAALPVEKMSAQALYNQRSIVQPGLISDLEEEVQHLIRFVALDGRTESGCPLWCFPGVIPLVTQFCLCSRIPGLPLYTGGGGKSIPWPV